MVVDGHFSIVVCPFSWWLRAFFYAFRTSEQALPVSPEGITKVGLCLFVYLFFGLTYTFQLLDKPYTQVSYLLPPAARDFSFYRA